MCITWNTNVVAGLLDADIDIEHYLKRQKHNPFRTIEGCVGACKSTGCKIHCLSLLTHPTQKTDPTLFLWAPDSF